MVTAMPGGAADKAGNLYEHLWVVLRITDLIEGNVSRIRLEPPGQAGTGIELEIDINGVTWGEQAKDSASNWTANRLISKGVLASAKAQLDRGRSFRLIVSSSAEALSTFGSRARKCNSLAEYSKSLGQDRLEVLARIAGAWEVTQEEAWKLLKGIEVEHYSLNALKRIVAVKLQQTYTEDADLIAGELRNFCETHVHEHFTAPQVSSHLESKSLTRRLIVGDRNVINALRKTRERHQRRVRLAEPTIGLVPSDEVDSILEMLRDPDASQVLVLDGPAGSGKSTIASSVAAALEEEGWLVAVARMDTDSTMATSGELGRRVGLTESPSVLLAGASAGNSALLVVDQLDAVSMYSGRMPDNFDAAVEVIAELERSPNIKVLLVVRTVDLDNDPRLGSLLVPENRVGRHTLSVLDRDAVTTKIVELGLRLPTSESVIGLLCSPLHFSVFSRLSASDQVREHRTLQDLYACFTDELRIKLERRVSHFDWEQAMGAIVNHMSDHEVLVAPAGLLDSVSIGEREALISESVVVRDGQNVAFFHESYFDYLFARSFIASGRDLHGFLLKSGQYLFRRAQTRQVIEHLAATDRRRFRAAIVQILSSNEIRYHLKSVVVSVLRQIQPTPEDWTALEPLLWIDTPLAPKLSLLLNVPDWFDAADGLGRWEEWLSDPARAERAFYLLSLVAKERPSRVSELVWPHIGESEEWHRRLSLMISRELNSGLVDLAVELVERGELDNDPIRIAANGDFWSTFYSLKDEDPAGAARLIGAFLRRGLVRAHEGGSPDPFESGHLSNNSQSASIIHDVAHAVPVDFVEHVLPFVVEVALADQYQPEGRFPASRRWGYTFWSRDYLIADVIINSIDDALQQLADDNPATCSAELSYLRIADSSELRFLACRALKSIGDSEDAISWMISDQRNLILGWAGSRSWASRELIEECSPGCSSDSFERLEEMILDHWPAFEDRRFRGHSQYVLLSVLDQSRMSEEGRRRLQELERRFPESSPEVPKLGVAQIVSSPIPEDASTRMTDDNWLQALQRYDQEGPNWNGHDFTGGSIELARTLGRRAKGNPDRFARLALRFDNEIPAVAMDEVLKSTEGQVEIEILTSLCEHAHYVYGSAVGRSVCSAIACAKEPSPRLVALLGVYGRDPDPGHESARTLAQAGGSSWEEGLFTAGLNSIRGEAALAVASALFSGADHLELLLPVLEDLIGDDILAVRVCAAKAVIALLIHESELALDFAERLFDAQIGVLDAHTSERLLGYATLRDPDRFAPLLAAALAGPDEVAMRAGRIWAALRWAGQLPPSVALEFRSLPTAARRGAAQAFAGHVADSHSDILQSLEDDDPEVLEQLGSAFGQLNQLASPDQVALLDALMASAAFPRHMQSLIHALADMTSALPVNTIDVCERVVEIAGTDLGDMRTGAALISSDLIAVVLRLYRQGDAALRTRCLNIIDRLAEFGVYDLELALENER